jgi:hypothetical protein
MPVVLRRHQENADLKLSFKREEGFSGSNPTLSRFLVLLEG